LTTGEILAQDNNQSPVPEEANVLIVLVETVAE
jgi:hypothetical protein